MNGTEQTGESEELKEHVQILLHRTEPMARALADKSGSPLQAARDACNDAVAETVRAFKGEGSITLLFYVIAKRRLCRAMRKKEWHTSMSDREGDLLGQSRRTFSENEESSIDAAAP